MPVSVVSVCTAGGTSWRGGSMNPFLEPPGLIPYSLVRLCCGCETWHPAFKTAKAEVHFIEVPGL